MTDYDNLLNNALYTREYFHQEDICRLCWSKDASNVLFSRMKFCTLKSPLFFKTQSCLGIDLSEDDSEYHPRKICEKCFLKIEQFNDFKAFCLNSNQKLNAILDGTENTESKLTLENVNLKDATKIEKNECNIIDLIDAESVDSFPGSFHNFDTEVESFDAQVENVTVTSNIFNLNITESSLPAANHCNQEINLKPSQTPKKNELRFVSTQPTCSSKNVSELAPKKISTLSRKYNNIRSPNRCNICLIDLKDEAAYLDHNSEAHGIERDGKLKCFGCGKLFNHRGTRFNHESYYCMSLEFGFKCNICGRHLPLRASYKRHLVHHRLNKIKDVPYDSACIFKCEKCSEQFTRRSVWYKHLLKHKKITKKTKSSKKKEEYVCETCGKVYSCKGNLTAHAALHSGIKPYKCDLCEYRTTARTALNIHIRKHTNERPYACDQCPMRCVSACNLNAHKRTHLGLRFQCAYCNKEYAAKKGLKNHIEIIHQKSQCNTCRICGAEYARRSGLRRHVHKKHPDKYYFNKIRPRNCVEPSITVEHQNTSGLDLMETRMD